MTKSFNEYFESTKNLPPSPLLIEALIYVKSSGKKALDLGCGAGRDTRYLVANGYSVSAMDNDPSAQKYIALLQPSDKIEFTHSTYGDFNFTEYDVINARYALPFNPRSSFGAVMQNVVRALRPGGVFAGQLFGLHDEWNTPGSGMTFCRLSEVSELFQHLEIVKLTEKEEDGKLVGGGAKHWHVFDVIARKKSVGLF